MHNKPMISQSLFFSFVAILMVGLADMSIHWVGGYTTCISSISLLIPLFSIQFLTWSRGRHSMFIHFFVCKLQNHCCAKKMGRGGGGGGSPPPGPPDATCLLQIPWSIRSSFKTKLMQDYFLQNLWLIYFDRTYGYIVRKSFCVCFEVSSDELKVSSMQ